MRGHLSPYYAPDFYTQALARGRHRDIVGGRWNETGEAQMALLTGLGLQPHHHLLDIGCGSLRLGCKAVPFLDPGHYWGTDMSAALMRRGYETELADKARLPPAQLIEDAAFDFPGVPEVIDHAISFAVFTHLPLAYLEQALGRLRSRFPRLEWLCFTVFLAPDAGAARGPVRQPDGVVTHPDRAPYHLLADDVARAAAAAGFALAPLSAVLPRGQAAFVARPG